MHDSFSSSLPGLESPATRLINITPDDDADLNHVSRALNVAATGSVRLTTIDGDTATIHVAAGGAFPVRATRIWATGTTATGIVVML